MRLERPPALIIGCRIGSGCMLTTLRGFRCCRVSKISLPLAMTARSAAEHHQNGLAEVDQLTQRCYAPLCSGGSFLSSCSSASVCKIIQLRGLRCENALPWLSPRRVSSAPFVTFGFRKRNPMKHSRVEFSMRSSRYCLFPRHSHSTVRGPSAPIQLEEMAFPGSQRFGGGALSGRLCLPRSQR
jgi:hypothetical protein